MNYTPVATVSQGVGGREISVELDPSSRVTLSTYGPAGGLDGFYGPELLPDVKRRELASALLNGLPLEPEAEEAPELKLPTTPGLYLDTDEDVWRLDDGGSWTLLSLGHDEYCDHDPAHYLPFVRLVPEAPAAAHFELVTYGACGDEVGIRDNVEQTLAPFGMYCEDEATVAILRLQSGEYTTDSLYWLPLADVIGTVSVL